MKVKITLLSNSTLFTLRCYLIVYAFQNFIGCLFRYDRFKNNFIAVSWQSTCQLCICKINSALIWWKECVLQYLTNYPYTILQDTLYYIFVSYQPRLRHPFWGEILSYLVNSPNSSVLSFPAILFFPPFPPNSSVISLLVNNFLDESQFKSRSKMHDLLDNN